MSQVTEAVGTLEGDELVEWLATFDYKPPPARPRQPPFRAPQYGAYYNEVNDAGTGRTAPDTWDEVEYLKDAGVLDRETYYAALERRQGDSKK